MFFVITLGDVIGWIITVLSVGIAVKVSTNVSVDNNGRKVNQGKSTVLGDQIAGDKRVGEK